MTILPGLLYTLVALPFGAFLITIGRKFFAIQSLQALVNGYKKDPKKFGWFEHYFLGFKFWNVTMTQWSLDAFGDKLITLWYRFSGVFFMVIGILCLITIPLMFFLPMFGV